MKENRTETRCKIFVGALCLIVTLLLTGIVREYEAKLENLEYEYGELQTNYKGAVDAYEDLQNQVWNVMNDEDYNLTIYHEGEHYTYTAEKQNWFYTKKETVIE